MVAANEDQARLMLDDILKVVRKWGLWHTIKEDRKPNLETIEVVTSIRIGGGK